MTEVQVLAETRVEKVKAHFRRNKKEYIVGAIGFVAGAVTVYFYGRSKGPVALESIVDSEFRDFKPTNVDVDTTIIQFPANGNGGNVVVDITTGIPYNSQNEAAKALGVHASRISDQIHGKRDQINGHQFVVVGAATPALPLATATVEVQEVA